jgi:hypothetical protein
MLDSGTPYASREEAQMSPAGFAIFCLVGFLLPVPILAWLDRPRAVP